MPNVGICYILYVNLPQQINAADERFSHNPPDEPVFVPQAPRRDTTFTHFRTNFSTFWNVREKGESRASLSAVKVDFSVIRANEDNGPEEVGTRDYFIQTTWVMLNLVFLLHVVSGYARVSIPPLRVYLLPISSWEIWKHTINVFRSKHSGSEVYSNEKKTRSTVALPYFLSIGRQKNNRTYNKSRFFKKNH